MPRRWQYHEGLEYTSILGEDVVHVGLKGDNPTAKLLIVRIQSMGWVGVVENLIPTVVAHGSEENLSSRSVSDGERYLRQWRTMRPLKIWSKSIPF